MPHLLSGIPCALDGSNHVLQALFIGGKVWRKATFITNPAKQSVGLEFFLQSVIGLNACTQALLKGVKNHEA